MTTTRTWTDDELATFGGADDRAAILNTVVGDKAADVTLRLQPISAQG